MKLYKWPNERETGVSSEVPFVGGISGFTGKLWPTRAVFLGVLTFRLANACALQTWFVPDEQWQSLEVAHRLVYGYVDGNEIIDQLNNENYNFL